MVDKNTYIGLGYLKFISSRTIIQVLHRRLCVYFESKLISNCRILIYKAKRSDIIYRHLQGNQNSRGLRYCNSKWKTQKKMGRRPSGLLQQGYLHPVWFGVGQEEVESFREVCRGHQRTLSPWSRRRMILDSKKLNPQYNQNSVLTMPWIAWGSRDPPDLSPSWVRACSKFKRHSHR